MTTILYIMLEKNLLEEELNLPTVVEHYARVVSCSVSVALKGLDIFSADAVTVNCQDTSGVHLAFAVGRVCCAHLDVSVLVSVRFDVHCLITCRGHGANCLNKVDRCVKRIKEILEGIRDCHVIYGLWFMHPAYRVAAWWRVRTYYTPPKNKKQAKKYIFLFFFLCSLCLICICLQV